MLQQNHVVPTREYFLFPTFWSCQEYSLKATGPTIAVISAVAHTAFRVWLTLPLTAYS